LPENNYKTVKIYACACGIVPHSQANGRHKLAGDGEGQYNIRNNRDRTS
jgi:hypothetical protein